MQLHVSRRGALAFALFVAATASGLETKNLDSAKIEQVVGIKPTVVEAENVVRIVVPRTDNKVIVDGTALPPFAGLTSWAAFRPGEKAEAMVMGDLVLAQDEVNPVMDACFDGGLMVTALHNHFLYDEPKVYFMHIAGEGPTEHLAAGVRKALDKVGEIRKATPQPANNFGGKPISQPSQVTAEPIEEILGKPGDTKDGMVKFSFGRTVRMSCGCEAGNAMGVNTWAAFVGADQHALVDGDFAVLEDELQVVLKTLRKANIKIVAIHHHMVGESPRTLFLHYWGVGPAEELARALRTALDAQRHEARGGGP